jgi:hypothetical protein
MDHSKSDIHAMNNASETDSSEDDHRPFHPILVNSLGSDNRTDEAFITLKAYYPDPHVKGDIQLKIDSGASGNTLPMRIYRQMFGDIPTSEILTPEPKIKLTSYSGNVIPCLGSITLGIRSKKHHEAYEPEKFYVVDVQGPAVCGLPTLRRRNIISLNVNTLTTHPTPSDKPSSIQTPITSISQLKSAYPNQFDRIGNFKEPARLHLKDDAIPFCDAPRKTSINLKPKIKEELRKMEENGVIRKVTEHSDWCSSLAYVTKQDGTLRICLDPQRLNQSLKRCPHKIPTLEELNPAFAHAKVFTKLDAKAGYWSVPLHADSQLITTFRTPFGRYCWQRLPFGLNVSQDIFQARMDIILEDLPGVASIADDICVFGTDQADHDTNLIRVMNRAAECGLVLNSSKCEIARDEINFFGNRYTGDGILPDPDKLRDLNNMPKPTSKEELQCFLGLMTYLSQHIPNFSSVSKPLRDLLKQDTPFLWEQDHDVCFVTLKQLVNNSKSLAYYDASKPVTLEVDASQKGLGAALLQEGRIIAFASKTLTRTQSNYSNIEREALGLVHGVERFHTYLYGREFTAITDHKPLVNIWQRPLTNAPPRLQRMFLRLQGYNFTLLYRPGSQMILSDALSRLPNPENNRNVSLDVRVDGITTDDIDCKPIELLNFCPSRLCELREETNRHPTLSVLKQIIIDGWPEDIKQCHNDIRPFFNHRECLAVEDGLIFKGRQVLIPESNRPIILEQLHASHQGVQKTQALARQSVFWPGINKDIEVMVNSCVHCQKYQAQQQNEPTLHHYVPPVPWTKLGSDLFQVHDKQYLLIVDYFTKYPVVIELKHGTSAEITKHFKSICSLLGRPATIVSDNGPQYSGAPFKQFTHEWGIEYITSSPKYPKSNGFAERHVGTVKHIIKKCLESRSDLDIALLHLRATPIDSKTVSPGELLFKRQLVTTLPGHTDPSPSHVDTRNHLVDRLQETEGQALEPLYAGQPITILDEERKCWQAGSVVRRLNEPRSYLVRTVNGS